MEIPHNSGNELLSLKNITGSDISQRHNLFIIDSNTLIQICGNSIVLQNLLTNKIHYVSLIHLHGVKSLTVHDSK